MSDDLDFMPADERGDEPDAGKASKSDGDRAPGERAELPTWNRSRRKRKANVKAEKADDVFQRGVRKASRQVIDTPKLVLGSIAIGILVIAGIVTVMSRQTAKRAEATRALQAATLIAARPQIMSEEELERVNQELRVERLPLFSSQEDADAALDEALAAAREVEADGVKLDVLLLAAGQAMRKGDFDAALADYDAFLAEAGDDHPLRFLALEGKGNAHEAKGELDEALAAFEQLAPDPIDHYRGMALYHRGRVLEGLERDDEAIAIYHQFFDEFSKEVAATPLVRDRLVELDPEFAAQVSAPANPGAGGLALPPM